jgi:hypothetical protein
MAPLYKRMIKFEKKLWQKLLEKGIQLTLPGICPPKGAWHRGLPWLNLTLQTFPFQILRGKN